MSIAQMIEMSLSINNFNRHNEYNGLAAMAKQLLNLLITEPGTYPSVPEMGVGISLYRMEFLNSQVINELKAKITEQSNKYVPNSHLIAEVLIEPMANGYNSHKTGVYIGFKLTTLNEITNDNNVIIIASTTDINDNSKTITEFHLT